MGIEQLAFYTICGLGIAGVVGVSVLWAWSMVTVVDGSERAKRLVMQIFPDIDGTELHPKLTDAGRARWRLLSSKFSSLMLDRAFNVAAEQGAVEITAEDIDSACSWCVDEITKGENKE